MEVVYPLQAHLQSCVLNFYHKNFKRYRLFKSVKSYSRSDEVIVFVFVFVYDLADKEIHILMTIVDAQMCCGIINNALF